MKITYEENFKSKRADGRHISTMAAHMEMLRNLKPALALPEKFTKEEFFQWKESVTKKLNELLLMPEFTEQPEPVLLERVDREGYSVEKWEFYPDDYTVVPFLIMIPHGVNSDNPAPGVLCFPGSAYSKESSAYEPLLPNKSCQDIAYPERNAMGKHIAQNGMVAFLFDNLETAECAAETDTVGYSREQMCHGYLMSGLCYPGMSVFHKLCFMKFLKKLDFVDKKNLAICGHSLGTETGLFLGLICDDFKALVFNDMMVDHLHRYVSVTESDGKMDQNIGNWHVVPDMFNWFDFPDLCAAFAPKYLALNEGGGEYYIEKIKRAYKVLGVEDHLQVTQYPKYSSPQIRNNHDLQPMYGMTLEEWRAYNYVDAPDHSFREEPSIKILKKCFNLK